MKIIEVSHSAVFNTGNYENVKFGLVAKVEEGEDYDAVANDLRLKCAQLAGNSKYELELHRRQLTTTINSLEKQLAEMKAIYEASAEFMKAQGLKNDMPPFPTVKPLPAPSLEVEDTDYREEEEDPDF